MTDKIKPATRADVEAIKSSPIAMTSPFIASLIATLESWEPMVAGLAAIDCQWWPAPHGELCLSCRARKLMEQYDA